MKNVWFPLTILIVCMKEWEGKGKPQEGAFLHSDTILFDNVESTTHLTLTQCSLQKQNTVTYLCVLVHEHKYFVSIMCTSIWRRGKKERASVLNLPLSSWRFARVLSSWDQRCLTSSCERVLSSSCMTWSFSSYGTHVKYPKLPNFLNQFHSNYLFDKQQTVLTAIGRNA